MIKHCCVFVAACMLWAALFGCGSDIAGQHSVWNESAAAAFEQSATIDSERDANSSQPAANYQPGYRHLEFTYRNDEEKRITRKLSFWYPTEDRVELPIAYEAVAKGTVEPAAVAEGAHPVIQFSHGLWSAPEFSSFLHEELARAGFLVIGPHHQDAVSEWENHQPKMPEFLKPEEWDDRRHADRAEDLRAVLDYLLAEQNTTGSFLHGRINDEQVGAMGHSLGGYTICGLVGGWPSWRDKRIRCALLLSPYIHPYLREGGGERIDVPVMFQGAWPGDLGITPFLPALYERLPQPKYLLVLEGANHFSWTNLVCEGRPAQEAVRVGSPELIVRYTIAFFDRYLRNNKAADAVLREKDRALNGYVFEDAEASLE